MCPKSVRGGSGGGLTRFGVQAIDVCMPAEGSRRERASVVLRARADRSSRKEVCVIPTRGNVVVTAWAPSSRPRRERAARAGRGRDRRRLSTMALECDSRCFPLQSSRRSRRDLRMDLREREREGARARARVEFGAARPHCPSQSSHCWPRRHSGPGGKCACCPLRERRSWAESQLRVGKSVAAPNVQMGQLQRSSCG